MKKLTIWTALGYIALSIMSVIWGVYAWVILLAGGFTKSFRLSKETIYVDGFGAILMAFIFLSLAAIALCVVFNRFAAPRIVNIITVAVLLGTPFMYLIFK